MRRQHRSHLIRGGLLAATLFSVVASISAGSHSPNPLRLSDPTGTLSTYSTAGGIDRNNPFFQNLGTNGRTCGSCQRASPPTACC